MSCSKDQPKNEPTSKSQTEEPAKRDWLDGKTFEFIDKLDKPAEERMANDYTLEFSAGRVIIKHSFEDGRKTDNLYTVVRSTMFGDYTYEKPVLTLKNLKGVSVREDYENGKLTSKEEKNEEPEQDHMLEVDEETGAILLKEGEHPSTTRIPLKK